MLSKEDNELLCRIGPGTPMGNLFRQYWLPMMKSDEAPAPDAPPVRIKLLGEELIAFRTTSNEIGLIQNACPHRGASLFFGRNEEEGLRCVYHGWKFDVDGACVDMPNEPAESDFKTKVKATSYRAQERGGVVWVYMGPHQATPPPLPDLEANMLPEGQYTLGIFQRECNYMQALEGDIDTGHTVFLHTGHLTIKDAPSGSWGYAALADRAPHYRAVDTNVGTMYTAYRPAGEDIYYRIAQFLFPFYTMIPTGVLGLEVRVRAWVPIDDGHTFGLGMHKVAGVDTSDGDRPFRDPTNLLPNTTEWLGRFRTEAN